MKLKAFEISRLSTVHMTVISSKIMDKHSKEFVPILYGRINQVITYGRNGCQKSLNVQAQALMPGASRSRDFGSFKEAIRWIRVQHENVRAE